jgi:hypothetical protein
MNKISIPFIVNKFLHDLITTYIANIILVYTRFKKYSYTSHQQIKNRRYMYDSESQNLPLAHGAKLGMTC